MNTGKTLFAQMDFLPWTTFTLVDRYGGDHRVRTLSCASNTGPWPSPS